MPEPRPLRADARRNREAIITAARSVFDNDEHLRFDDFAARAGVGIGTLYRHFPTREALAAAVYHGEVAALCAVARESTLPPKESLVALLHAFVDYIIEHAGLARTLAAVVDPAVQVEGGNEFEACVRDLVARAVDDGTIRDDVEAGALMVILHGIGSATDRPSWASESRSALDLVIAGLDPR
jgi:AcrR family transcriptional regulator